MARNQIRANDRVFFVGATGSGKTTLAKSLLWGQEHVVILDPKHTFSLPKEWPHGHMTSDHLDKLQNDRTGQTLIYRPDYDEQQDKCETFFRWIFDRRNCIVFVDEIMSVCPGGRIGHSYARCIQLGRERGIGTWSATQRPALVPLVTLTEAQRMYVFRLKNPVDRKRMAEYGDLELGESVKHPNGYREYDERTGDVRYWKSADVGKVLR